MFRRSLIQLNMCLLNFHLNTNTTLGTDDVKMNKVLVYVKEFTT